MENPHIWCLTCFSCLIPERHRRQKFASRRHAAGGYAGRALIARPRACGSRV